MSQVMQLLEALARDPAFGATAEHARLLEQVDSPVREAVLAGDPVALRTALGGRALMVCSINVPSDDENDFQEQPVAPDDQQPDESDIRAA